MSWFILLVLIITDLLDRLYREPDEPMDWWNDPIGMLKARSQAAKALP